MKLLIADDSMTQRVMLEAICRQWGFDVVLAEDGQQAWEILDSGDAPRLVLLDWEMPGLDGLAVCQRVRARQDDDPPYILLLTARHETADIVAGLEAGANDYLSKPFENTELRARLQVGARMLDLQRELNQARDKLEHQASHDALTGLLNRGAAMKCLEREMKRARRGGKTLQVGLVDVDHFKKINDTRGHLVGDAVLREMARRLEGALQPGDRVGRYGGEEFLVLSRGADSDLLPERLRRAVADRPFEHEELSLEVTISGGFTCFHLQERCSATALLAAADSALYAAKNAGRNRIEFAETPDITNIESALAVKTAISAGG